MSLNDEKQYGEELYYALFEMVGNKKNTLLLESLRGENAVLTYLVNHREEIHPGTLAEHLSLVPGRTADILKSLEKKGLIIRRKDPEDRRKTIVSITEDGVLYIKERRKRIRDQYSGLYKELGAEDTVKLIELLKKMNNYFEKM